jgi:phosphatidylglycerol:prolipoprotein diacylglycerol transferase
LLVALGFLAAVSIGRWLGRRRGIPDTFMMDLGALCIGSGIIGARILYVLLNLDFFRENPLAVFKIWEGGLVFYGGFIAAAVAAVLWTRRAKLSLTDVADICAPAVAIGQGIGRIGCLMAGCCYGKPAVCSWAVTYRHPEALAPLGIALHPTQAYEALGDLALGLGLILWFLRFKPLKGTVFWAYLLGYGILRYSVETFRGDDRGVVLAALQPSQWIAVIAILIAATMLAVRYATTEKHGHA